MANKKTIKIIKITAIVLASIIAVSVAGMYVAFRCVIKPKTQDIIKAVDKILADEEIQQAVKPYLQSEEMNEILKNIGETAGIDNTGENVSEQTENESQQSAGKTPAEKNSEPKNNQAQNNNSSSKNKTAAQATAKPKDRSEYNSQYDYVKDNVPASDFSRGMALVSRVDIGYVTGLLSGGLTAKEKSELKSYLTSRFSGSEIAEGMALYSKYSYLLR